MAGTYQIDPMREVFAQVVEIVLERLDKGATPEELRALVAEEVQREAERVAALNEKEEQERREAMHRYEREQAAAAKRRLPPDQQDAFNHFVEAMVAVYWEEYAPGTSEELPRPTA